MIEDKDKIKDLFSSKLKDFEPEVPASLWGGLDQLLSQQAAPADPSSASSSTSSSSGSSVATASKVSLIKTALITVGVAAAVVTGVLLIPKGSNLVVPEEPKVATIEEAIQDTIKLDDTTFVISPRPAIRPIIARAELQEKNAVVDVQVSTPSQDPEKESIKPEKKEEVKEKSLRSSDDHKVVQLLPKKKSGPGLSVGLSTNSALFGQDISQSGGRLLFSYPTRGRSFNDALAKENKEFKLQHSLPISFGLKVSKSITPNLSLETGIVYTYLSSKITSNSAFNIRENQYFHYLGVPLTLNYKFYELGKAKFYLSAGGMVQKDIKGQYESKIAYTESTLIVMGLPRDLYYSEPYYIKESIKQANPQFSANVGIGGAYPIYKKLYLYGTIGGAYYFDAGNKYSTIYSDRKIQLDFNLGVKFDF